MNICFPAHLVGLNVDVISPHKQKLKLEKKSGVKLIRVITWGAKMSAPYLLATHPVGLWTLENINVNLRMELE